MKKIMFVLLYVSIALTGYAQDVPINANRDSPFEISVGGSVRSAIGGIIVMPAYAIINALSTTNEQEAESKIWGLYSLDFMYHINHWLAAGADITMEGETIRKYKKTDETLISVSQLYSFAIMPAVRFTYLNRPVVKLYSGVQLGCYLLSSTTSKSQVTFGGNATLLGVSAGK